MSFLSSVKVSGDGDHEARHPHQLSEVGWVLEQNSAPVVYQRQSRLQVRMPRPSPTSSSLDLPIPYTPCSHHWNLPWLPVQPVPQELMALHVLFLPPGVSCFLWLMNPILSSKSSLWCKWAVAFFNPTFPSSLTCEVSGYQQRYFKQYTVPFGARNHCCYVRTFWCNS